jgi:hypothetical protein
LGNGAVSLSIDVPSWGDFSTDNFELGSDHKIKLKGGVGGNYVPVEVTKDGITTTVTNSGDKFQILCSQASGASLLQLIPGIGIIGSFCTLVGSNTLYYVRLRNSRDSGAAYKYTFERVDESGGNPLSLATLDVQTQTFNVKKITIQEGELHESIDVPCVGDFHEDDFELSAAGKIRTWARVGNMYPRNISGFFDVTTFVCFAVNSYEKIDAGRTKLVITTNFEPRNCSQVKFIFFIPVTRGGEDDKIVQVQMTGSTATYYGDPIRGAEWKSKDLMLTHSEDWELPITPTQIVTHVICHGVQTAP